MTYDPTRTSHPTERTAVASPPSGDMGLDELEADYELRGRDDLRAFLSTRPEVVPLLRRLRSERNAADYDDLFDASADVSTNVELGRRVLRSLAAL